MKSNLRLLFPMQLLPWALLAGSAHASTSSGQTMPSAYLFPDTSTIFAGPTTSVVGPGVELTSFAGFANIDFSDANLWITITRNAGVNNVAFDGFEFTAPVVTFAGVTLNGATNDAGITSSRLDSGDPGSASQPAPPSEAGGRMTPRTF